MEVGAKKKRAPSNMRASVARGNAAGFDADGALLEDEDGSFHAPCSKDDEDAYESDDEWTVNEGSARWRRPPPWFPKRPLKRVL